MEFRTPLAGLISIHAPRMGSDRENGHLRPRYGQNHPFSTLIVSQIVVDVLGTVRKSQKHQRTSHYEVIKQPERQKITLISTSFYSAKGRVIHENFKVAPATWHDIGDITVLPSTQPVQALPSHQQANVTAHHDARPFAHTSIATEQTTRNSAISFFDCLNSS